MAGIASGAASGAAAGSAFGPWGTVIGGVVGAAGGLLNKKSAPATVPYTPVDLQATQNQAISGDLAATPSIDQLLSQSNTFQQGQASALMEKALPGYGQFASNLTKTASDLAANPYAVPKSVTDQLTQYAAENNIAGGTGAASGFSESNILRSLGVNALQYGQSNLTAATNALSVLTGTAPRVSPMSPMSFLVTPDQQTQNQQLTNRLQQQIGQGGANASTAATNFNTGNLWDTLTSTITPSAVNNVASLFNTNPSTGTPNTSVGSGLSPAPASFAGK
jgi:hypothetical protein